MYQNVCNRGVVYVNWFVKWEPHKIYPYRAGQRLCQNCCLSFHLNLKTLKKRLNHLGEYCNLGHLRVLSKECECAIPSFIEYDVAKYCKLVRKNWSLFIVVDLVDIWVMLVQFTDATCSQSCYIVPEFYNLWWGWFSSEQSSVFLGSYGPRFRIISWKINYVAHWIDWTVGLLDS